MNKCLFIAVFAVLWSGCSRSDQAGVPNSIYEAFAIHPDSARFESLMLDLVESGDQTEEACLGAKHDVFHKKPKV